MAGQHFCEDDWSKLKKKHQSLDEEDLLRYCFSSAYIVALLHDSLEIALDDERISLANQVNDIPLDWALGAFILQSTTNSAVQHTDWMAHIIDIDSKLLSIIGFSTILMFTAWSISKWRKPHLKTPYQPDYTAPPRPRTEETAIHIGGGWTISGTPLDLSDPRILAIAVAECQFLEIGYDEYAVSSATAAALLSEENARESQVY
ncbi:hypothetical protein F3Y22_tig00111220pilonHSYRG00166 [Hibiscus syriacus]|uniref:apyrase n=1 Tax=Hibiscus syriacus TaxID=106335 RepID=A0A6A2YVN0_HIBSY|nr:hypothetical protein F3Y22_tig00111220pilonHSYRG00166 [Hibiscus syriacus]